MVNSAVILDYRDPFARVILAELSYIRKERLSIHLEGVPGEFQLFRVAPQILIFIEPLRRPFPLRAGDLMLSTMLISLLNLLVQSCELLIF